MSPLGGDVFGEETVNLDDDLDSLHYISSYGGYQREADRHFRCRLGKISIIREF